MKKMKRIKSRSNVVELGVESEKANAVISFMGEGLLLVDKNSKILIANQAAGALLRQPPANLENRKIKDALNIVGQGKKIVLEKTLKEVMELGEVIRFGLHKGLYCYTEDKKSFPIALTFSPFLTKKLKGVVVLLRDISEEKALAESKNNFISITSHQLRTPLTSIRWYAEMLNDLVSDSNAAEQKKFAEEIYKGALRLAEIINVMLSLARIENKEQDNDLNKISVPKLALEVVETVKVHSDKKKQTIEVLSDPLSSEEIKMNCGKLRQALSNIIVNSIQYTPVGGKILVGLKREAKEILCSVKDDGIGIPLEHQKKIFEKFSRASNAMAAFPDGSGLGLVLTKELVNSWGGKIWFDSKENRGTTFYFTIPLQ